MTNPKTAAFGRSDRKLSPIGLIGIGRMGSGLAGCLGAHGHTLVGWDPDVTCLSRFQETGGSAASGAAGVFEEATIVVSSLPDEAALRAFVESRTAMDDDAACRIVIETSTLPWRVKKKAIDALRAAGVRMLDAPLIGGAMQAREGKLTVLAAGEVDLFDECLPVLQTFSAQQHYVGVDDAATKLKLVVNHFVSVSNVLIAETMLLATRVGLDAGLVDRVIGSSPAASGLWRARLPRMLDRDYDDPVRQSAQLAIMLKDNALISALAEPTHSAMPLFSAAATVYAEAVLQGRQQQDPAALLDVLESMSEQ